MSSELNRREYLKAFFGSTSQLDIMARVALLPIEPPEHFYAKRIAVETGFPANVVSFEIERMSRLGMVDRVEGGYREGQSTGMPPNWYVRCASQLWDVVNLAVQVVNTEFPDC